MFRRAIILLMAAFFLAGSALLPLGDFSLLRDIPSMYTSYTKIADPDEVGPIDFIGDYLLNGKEIFGNNRGDKAPLNGNAIQFQHQANAHHVVLLTLPINLFIPPENELAHPLFRPYFHTSDFRDELLRPPLA